MSEQAKEKEFIATARKWRPMRFSDVVGQGHITSTLKNALKSGRIHHAYLFCGPRGVGKTTTARILARAANCANPQDSEPCNECRSCKSVLEGSSMDVIEIDGASNNSVEDVRKLRENAKYPPVAGSHKMYIIDEVHMLSTSAFNALLKTLEEPPPHLLFVFATTESHKVPATIISRCQKFDFRRMESADIVKQLKFIAEREDIKIDEESLAAIATKADGSMRDGQSMFDQVRAFCGSDIKYAEMADALNLIDRDFFFRISDSISAGDLKDVFEIASEVADRGYDMNECLAGLLEHFRNILTVIATDSTKLIDASEKFLLKYKSAANTFQKADVLRYMKIIANSMQAMRFAPQPKIRFETALVQLASLDKAVDVAELIKEIKDLKKKAPNDQALAAATAPQPNAAREAKPARQYSPEKTERKVEKRIESPAQPKSEPAPAQPNPFGKVPAEKLKSGWSEYISSIVKKDGDIDFFANGDIKIEFADSLVLANTSQDLFVDLLNEKGKNISNSISNYFGAPVDLKIEKIVDENAYANSENKDLALNSSKNRSYEKADVESAKYQLEKEIIRHFDAFKHRIE